MGKTDKWLLGKGTGYQSTSLNSNNRLQFHGGEISNQKDLSRENVNSLKEKSPGNKLKKKLTTAEFSKCSFLCHLLRDPPSNTRQKPHPRHAPEEEDPAGAVPGSGASPALALRQDIIHPLSGKADVFVSNLLSKHSRHQANNFFMIL